MQSATIWIYFIIKLEPVSFPGHRKIIMSIEKATRRTFQPIEKYSSKNPPKFQSTLLVSRQGGRMKRASMTRLFSTKPASNSFDPSDHFVCRYAQQGSHFVLGKGEGLRRAKHFVLITIPWYYHAALGLHIKMLLYSNFEGSVYHEIAIRKYSGWILADTQVFRLRKITIGIDGILKKLFSNLKSSNFQLYINGQNGRQIFIGDFDQSASS